MAKTAGRGEGIASLSTSNVGKKPQEIKIFKHLNISSLGPNEDSILINKKI